MGISALDSAIFADMFGTAPMRETFGDDPFLARCIEVEAALARDSLATDEIVPLFVALLFCGVELALTLVLDSSARTVVAIFAESSLYRAAVRARFEFFSSDCFGL